MAKKNCPECGEELLEDGNCPTCGSFKEEVEEETEKDDDLETEEPME